MAPMTTNGTPLPYAGQEVKDFSDVGSERVVFRIGDDIFEGVEDLPSELAMEYADSATRLEDEDLPITERIEIMRNMFRLVLKPESAERFIGRLRDPENPIGGRKLRAILPWLFEQYAERPTTSDEDSSTSSENPEPGTKSLASAPNEESIYGVSV